MRNVTFRLVAALKVMDAMTKMEVTDARIVSCHSFRRLNKENGIIVLVDDKPWAVTEEKEIRVDSPYYQHVMLTLNEVDTGRLRKVWLVPGPKKGLPDAAAVISGQTEPHTSVSCEFINNESGLRLTESITGNEICLSTFECLEPEGSEFIVSDGKNEYKIYIVEKLEEGDGFNKYRFVAESELPEMDKLNTLLYPVVTVEAGEDGQYYLPVYQKFDDEGWNAKLVFSRNDKRNERDIVIKSRTRLTEDCLKL